MVDLSDVEDALLRVAAGALYPEGPQAPSVVGRVCRIYRGWPQEASLAADMGAGHVHVTVFPEARGRAVAARLGEACEVLPAAPLGLSVTVAGRSATVAGEAREGQVAGLLVDGMAVVHRIARGDTPEMVAAVLAAYLRTRFIVTVDGATLTVAGQGPMLGRVVADRTIRRQTRRQRHLFRLTAWCPDPALRDRVAAVLDGVLSGMDFIDLPDGGAGRLLFRGAAVQDQGRRVRLFRRDLLYAVDYATTVAETLPVMIFGDMRFGAPARSFIG